MTRRRQNAVGRTVYVVDGNVTKAIKKLRRIMKQNNILQDYHDKRYYIKPSQLKKQKNKLKQWKIKNNINAKQKQYQNQNRD